MRRLSFIIALIDLVKEVTIQLIDLLKSRKQIKNGKNKV